MQEMSQTGDDSIFAGGWRRCWRHGDIKSLVRREQMAWRGVVGTVSRQAKLSLFLLILLLLLSLEFIIVLYA